MVAGQAGCKMRKSTLRNAVARLLVLGHHEAGKSAAIVRYTTGRFIQTYCSSTNDWLYRHPIGYDSARNQYKVVELLEQKDIEFSNSVSRDSEQQQQQQQQQQQERPPGCSLSSRVALDRQIDHEFYEKQQLLNKLHWANAYVILYALNDTRSFNKAIKYLNLIANEVNRQPTSQQSPARRPILLVGNKRDLTHSANTRQARRVSHSDGRLLAIRHQCLFAELSVSEAAGPIEQAISNLVEAIHASELHTSRINGPSSDLAEQILTQTQLTYWIPLSVCQMYEQQNKHAHNQAHSNGQQPIWSTLVKTRLPQSYRSVSQTIVQSSCLAIKATRLNEADFRLLTPVGMSLSSSSSSPASSNSSGCVGTANSVRVKMQQAQVAQPLLASAPAAPADVVQTAATSVIGLESVAQRTTVSRPSLSSISSMSSGAVGSNCARSHLSSFRSSFRKGALAIVGSRSLAARAAGGASRENERFTKTTPRSSLSSIQTQDTLSSMSQAASDSDTSSAGTVGAVRQSSLESIKKPPSQRVNWIKSKISSLGRQETTARNSDTGPIGQQQPNEQHHQQEHPTAVSRFRRPLFRYRSRRKTLAFEPTFETNELPSGSSLGLDARSAHNEQRQKQHHQHFEGSCLEQLSGAAESISASRADLTAQPGSSLADPLAGCSNHLSTELHHGRGSGNASSGSPLCSMATATVASTKVLSNEASSSVYTIHSVYPAKPNNIEHGVSRGFCLPAAAAANRPASVTQTNLNTLLGKGSHPILSQASTSGGSHDEDSELELSHQADLSESLTRASNSGTNLRKKVDSETGHGPLVKPVKARYQLVKTVQSTLTNLTKAVGGQSPSSAWSNQTAKRSSCSALLGRDSATTPALITDGLQFAATVAVGGSQMAQVERIQTLPLMGFCK